MVASATMGGSHPMTPIPGRAITQTPPTPRGAARRPVTLLLLALLCAACPTPSRAGASAPPAPAEAQSVVAALFPGDPVTAIHLDPTDPLAGPPAAWETLDAVLIDDAGLARLGGRKVDVLAASGVAFAVRGARP